MNGKGQAHHPPILLGYTMKFFQTPQFSMTHIFFLQSNVLFNQFLESQRWSAPLPLNICVPQ